MVTRVTDHVHIMGVTPLSDIHEVPVLSLYSDTMQLYLENLIAWSGSGAPHRAMAPMALIDMWRGFFGSLLTQREYIMPVPRATRRLL